jgi:hypothetical protein
LAKKSCNNRNNHIQQGAIIVFKKNWKRHFVSTLVATHFGTVFLFLGTVELLSSAIPFSHTPPKISEHRNFSLCPWITALSSCHQYRTFAWLYGNIYLSIHKCSALWCVNWCIARWLLKQVPVDFVNRLTKWRFSTNFISSITVWNSDIDCSYFDGHFL